LKPFFGNYAPLDKDLRVRGKPPFPLLLKVQTSLDQLRFLCEHQPTNRTLNMPLSTATTVAFLVTRDREKAKAFYRDVLGFTHVSSDEFAEVFDMNGAPMRIVPIADHVPSPHTVLGWDVEDLSVTAVALKAKGVEFQIYEGFGQDENGVWSAPGGRAKIAWFLDPDGNNLSVSEHAVG
jgi:catechol 2,3-dioxygenase-like lactoylglutathione lyase family enzyme